jgi:hypothetical protein
MPHSDLVPIIELPIKPYWNEEPKTEYLTEPEAFRVEMLDYPKGNFRKRCAQTSMSTWNYEPAKLSTKEVNEIFKKILGGKMLPNSMESLMFSFRFKNLTHIEISHILRHRMFSGIMAVCTADRDLRHDKVMIPTSISGTKFEKRYREMVEKTKELYAEMIDSKEISFLDARYILPRNHCYDYHISINLKEIINFIKQRRCTQIQPYSDNLIAQQLYIHITNVIPELKEFLSIHCDKSCFFCRTANLGEATNLYLPDKYHDTFDWNKNNFIYGKLRKDMGIPDIE